MPAGRARGLRDLGFKALDALLRLGEPAPPGPFPCRAGKDRGKIRAGLLRLGGDRWQGMVGGAPWVSTFVRPLYPKSLSPMV